MQFSNDLINLNSNDKLLCNESSDYSLPSKDVSVSSDNFNYSDQRLSYANPYSR